MQILSPDMAGARSARHGWIARRSETYRHLPPPGPEDWFPAPDTGGSPDPSDASADARWDLLPIGDEATGGFEAGVVDDTDSDALDALFERIGPARADEHAPFERAHRAACRQALVLRIGARQSPGEPPRPVALRIERRGAARLDAPLLVIELAPGANCVIVESHGPDGEATRTGGTLNLRACVRLGAGASLRHLRLASPGRDDCAAHCVQVRLDGDARYDQATIASGSRYHLQRTEVDLAGAGSSVRIAGVLLARDAALEQQADIRHTGTGTRSAIESLGLASGTARTVINAHTGIAAGADEASARQRLHGIPTAGHPRMVLRPQLEIDHDNVQASHGATWGALPDDALFYARQRGLDEDRARGLIIEGMATAIVSRCLDEPGLSTTLALESIIGAEVARHLACSSGAQHA